MAGNTTVRSNALEHRAVGWRQRGRISVIGLTVIAGVGLSLGCGHDNCHTDCLPTDIPADLANITSPIETPDPAHARHLFERNCQGCHGEAGRGDGPLAPTLDPPAADLTTGAHGWTDGYVYWRIRDGATGGPSGSTMPAFGDSLNDDEIWQLVAYVRSLSR